MFAADLIAATADELDSHVVCLLATAGSPVRFGVPTTVVGTGSGRYRELAAVARLARELSRHRPDVVVAHGGQALRATALAGLGRSTPPIVYRKIGAAGPGAATGARRTWHQWLLGRAAMVAAVAGPLAAEAIETFGADREKVTRIANGVDPERVQPVARDEARAALDLPSDAFVVLSLGALTWEKDPLLALDVVAGVRRTHGDVVHLVVGDGPLRPQVESKAREHESVRVLGARPDVGTALGAADVLLLTSRADGMEGMPATVIEAGLAGLPVVAPRVAGLAEVVVGGETGLLAEPGDADGLRIAIAALAEDAALARKLGGAAADRCRDRFTIEVVAEQYVELLDQLAD